MKRMMLVMLALVLCLPLQALASGLPNLGGSGLPQINVEAAPTGVLPDPADLGGERGETFATDYKYTADFICTVYTYPRMDAAFVDKYTAAAVEAGYALEETELEGFQVRRFTFDGKSVLLFPDYSGVTMLMVQNGIAFGEPLPEGDYIAFTRNGRPIATPEGARISMSKGTGFFGMGETFKVEYYFREEPVTLFTLAFPAYAREGDEFKVSAKQTIKCLSLYTSEDEFMVHHEDNHGDEMEGSADYYNLKITKLVKTDSLVQVEGTFEGVFNNGSLTYEDGSFRAEMAR